MWGSFWSTLGSCCQLAGTLCPFPCLVLEDSHFYEARCTRSDCPTGSSRNTKASLHHTVKLLAHHTLLYSHYPAPVTPLWEGLQIQVGTFWSRDSSWRSLYFLLTVPPPCLASSAQRNLRQWTRWALETWVPSRGLQWNPKALPFAAQGCWHRLPTQAFSCCVLRAPLKAFEPETLSRAAATWVTGTAPRAANP